MVAELIQQEESMKKNKLKETVMMKRILMVLTLTIIAASFLFLTGCQKRAVTKPAEVPEAAKEQPGAVEQKRPEKITEQKPESVTSRDVDAQAAEGRSGMFQDIFFEYDRYDVDDRYKSDLQAVAAWMMKNSSATIMIEGHTDERGTNEYNLALGDRRAKAVKDFVVSLGVQSSRIETISYGEEKPVCSDETEDCWAKNRRAHFLVFEKAGR
jgi:peptidoglycan-associated lipoprotein